MSLLSMGRAFTSRLHGGSIERISQMTTNLMGTGWQSPVLRTPASIDFGSLRGMKTVSSVKKRFRLTGSGNVKRGQAYMRHGTGPKSRSRRKQSMGQTRLVTGLQKKKLLKMMGCG